MFIFKVIKSNKIYKKAINYLCDILGLKYQFFNRKVLLKLNYEVVISKKKKQNYQKNFIEIFLKF